MSSYKFKRAGPDNKPFDVVGQAGIQALESITAVDKALAVPYIQIWRVCPNTGLPYDDDGEGKPRRPLTVLTSQVPAFGSSVDETMELRERPPISLESINIKTNNPLGLINWHSIDINLVVHRPDIVFQKPAENVDAWYSLITPGCIHALEWGWSANEGSVKNGILNGNGLSGEYQLDNNKAPWLIPGRKIMRFSVVNYQFHIGADQQIRLSINGLEDGEFSIRRTWLVPGSHPTKGKDCMMNTMDPKPEQSFDKQIKTLTQLFKKRLYGLAIKVPNKKIGKVVRIEDICNALFADNLGNALKETGYTGDISLYIGNCNAKVPTPQPAHAFRKQGGAVQTGKDAGYIGDFTVPLKDVEDKMMELLKNGQQLTLYNFITPFLAIFQDPSSWNMPADRLSITIPEVQMKFQANKDKQGKQQAIIYIADVKSELIRFTKDDKKKYEDLSKDLSKGKSNVPNRDAIRQVCQDKGIPYVEFMKGNSWIQDAQFEVIQDELTKAIFIEKWFKPQRQDIIGTSKAQAVSDTMDYRESLYSSAIKGTLTCIGNHAFDIWGLYWLDFSVPKWSGPFRVSETSETISPGGWTKTLNLIAEGSDPLGTQGRPIPVPPAAPKAKKTQPGSGGGGAKKGTWQIHDQQINRSNPWINPDTAYRFIVWDSSKPKPRIPQYAFATEDQAKACMKKLNGE
jgi:hypothetical protein